MFGFLTSGATLLDLDFFFNFAGLVCAGAGGGL